MVKLLAMDLDHTLLNLDNQIADKTLLLLERCRERGVVLALATGRFFPSAQKYAKLLGNDCKIVCYNGSIIKNGDGKTLFSTELSVEVMKKLVRFTKERGLYLQFYQDDKILVERLVEETRIDPDLKNGECLEAVDFDRWTFKPSPKAMIVEKPENVPDRQKELEAFMDGCVYLAQSQKYLIEIMPEGVNKARSLERLAQSLGIQREEVMVCGDNTNDAEMVQWAGTGVCVANGVDALKQIADYVTEAQRSAGVAEAIQKFILKE